MCALLGYVLVGLLLLTGWAPQQPWEVATSTQSRWGRPRPMAAQEQSRITLQPTQAARCSRFLFQVPGWALCKWLSVPFRVLPHSKGPPFPNIFLYVSAKAGRGKNEKA